MSTIGTMGTQTPSPLGILLLGGSGYLGRGLWAGLQALAAPAAEAEAQSQQIWPGEQTWQVWQSQHRDPAAPHYFNLASPDLSPFEAVLPHVNCALICGARPGLRDCYEAPEATWQINVTGPLTVAQALVAQGITPVLFSSDYVFDGKQAPYSESDWASPLNPYGQQKAALEAGLKQHLGEYDYLLLRLTKLYDLAPRAGSLLAEMAEAWQQGQTIRAASDQVFNPLLLEDCVRAILGLLKGKARGVYNLGGPEGLSRYALAQDLAQNLAKSLGIDTGLLQAIELRDLNEPFLRPQDTRLSLNRVQEALPDWQPMTPQAAVRAFCQSVQAHGQALQT